MLKTKKCFFFIVSIINLVFISNSQAYDSQDYYYHSNQDNNRYQHEPDDKFYNFSHPYSSQGSRGGYSNYWDEDWNQAHDRTQYDQFQR